MRLPALINDLLADAKFGLRSLRKQFVPFAAGIATLTIGMAVVTVLFGVYNAAILGGPAYLADGKLRAITESYERSWQGFSMVSPTTAEAVRSRRTSFSRVGAYRTQKTATLDGGQAVPLLVTEVDTALLGMLGVAPEAGRILSALEIAEQRPVVILSSRLAKRLGPSTDVLGRTIRLRAGNYSIVGIMPDGFNFPDRSDAWLPLDESRRNETYAGPGSLSLLAEMQHGVSDKQAQNDLDGLARHLRSANPKYYREIVLRLRDEAIDRQTIAWKPVLALLLGAGFCVMLIGYVNVGNLLLMRAAERRGEFALRVMLGATLGRITRQIASESAILSGLAASISLVLVLWLLQSADHILPLADMPTWFQLTLDLRVLALLVAVAVLAIAIISASAVRHLRRLDLSEELKSGGANATSAAVTRSGERAIRLQVMLCAVLSLLAGVFLRAYSNAADMPLGYDNSGTFQVRLDLDPVQYRDSTAQQLVHRRLTERLAQSADVEFAAREAPFVGFFDASAPSVDREVYGLSATPITATSQPPVQVLSISDDYLVARRIPMIAGRAFRPSDTVGAQKVAIVTRRLAEQLAGEASPLGRQFRVGRAGPLVTIIGVTSDIRDPGTASMGLRDSRIPAAFFSDRQSGGAAPLHWIRLHGQTDGALGRVTAEIRQSTAGLTPFTLRAPTESEGVVVSRIMAVALTLTCGLGLFMAVVGIHAVTGYAVTQRTRVIGIQLALGAAPVRVYVEIVRRGLFLVGSGLVLGLCCGAALELVVNPNAWGAKTFAFEAYVVVAVVFMTVAALASHRAATRGSQIQPSIALRA